MPSVVVIGAQFGDEGKGKIVDFLSKKAHAVVRYQGGSNAGHTVVVGDKTFKFHLLPSGVVSGKQCYIGNGVAFDPEIFLEEVSAIKKMGISPKITISPLCHVVFDFHKKRDERREKKENIGTTKRGIGPLYTDKVSRVGIRMSDFVDLKKLKDAINSKSEIRDKKSTISKYSKMSRKIKPFVSDVVKPLNDKLNKKRNVIFEGAQGTLLDIDFGTYPYVTSSNPTSGGACTGSGVPPSKINNVVGIAKAYCTRVGEGPFPTEITGTLSDKLREAGGEYGTTTGRPRRVGWLDIPMLRYSSTVNGFTSIALTKTDVLCDMETVKICTGYKIGSKKTASLSPETVSSAKPIYKNFKGWSEPKKGWSSVKKFADLPKELKSYIRFIENQLNVKVNSVSFGPKRSQTIIIGDPWN